MKSVPILFSGPMVRAILEGRKTQTRRIVKPPKRFWSFTVEGGKVFVHPDNDHRNGDVEILPKAAAGDELWVREAWRVGFPHDNMPGSALPESTRVSYEADGLMAPRAGRYRHARFMPRWASRLTLTVKAVRVERLWDVTDKDCMAEGIEHRGDVDPLDHVSMWKNYMHPKEPSPYWNSPRDSYHSLWDSINGEGAWDANPWVWVYEFEVKR